MAKIAKARKKTAQVVSTAEARLREEQRNIRRVEQLAATVRKNAARLERSVTRSREALSDLTDWLVASGHGTVTKGAETDQ